MYIYSDQSPFNAQEHFADYLTGNYPEITTSTMMYTINQRGLSNPATDRKTHESKINLDKNTPDMLAEGKIN